MGSCSHVSSFGHVLSESCSHVLKLIFSALGALRVKVFFPLDDVARPLVAEGSPSNILPSFFHAPAFFAFFGSAGKDEVFLAFLLVQPGT